MLQRHLPPHRATAHCLLAATVVGLCMLGTVQPALSGTTGATGAAVEIMGGALAITVPPGSVALGSRVNTVGGGTIAGPLGVVKVDDARSLAAGGGWVASAISTAFTGPGGAIPATAVAYTAGQITPVGTVNPTANDAPSLSGVAPVVTATGITGDNSATWDPTITVTVPGGMAAGVYSATITHSVA